MALRSIIRGKRSKNFQVFLISGGFSGFQRAPKKLFDNSEFFNR